MTARQSSPTSDHSHSDSGVRKRVCKACDRCRLKKSKCDGGNPCGRCRADNAICVFGERKKAHDKVYPKGYVEMLEQQQAWLVNGLQELYRLSSDGESWPGERLKNEPNGHPLTHDLLTRLGALDHSKSERFEENPDAMQQELWRQNAGHMQRQESSDDGSESPQSSPVTVVSSRFADAFARSQLPPTPPSFSPSLQAQQHQPQHQHQHQHPSIKQEQPHMPMTTSSNHPPAFSAQLSMQALQGVVNPIALQQHWPSHSFGAFDEMDLMGPADYANLSFEEQIPSPMFNRSVPMGYMDAKNDYDDFNQFLNPNPTEITSI